MRQLLLLLLLCCSAPTWAASKCLLADSNGCCSSPTCWEKTCAALYRLGTLLSAPAWVNSTGWITAIQASEDAAIACSGITNASYCKWHGVQCNDTQMLGNSNSCFNPAAAGGVSRIELTNNNLRGQINDSRIFDEVKLLHDCGMTHLVIGGTSFGLTGTLTPEWGQLDRLHVFAVFGANITGTIPAQLGNMAALQELDLSTCYLSGTIPPELGRLENLRMLNLGLNGFSDIGVAMHGPLPRSFLNLRQLRMLNLEQNSFSGTLPPTLCTDLKYLQAISLQNNKFLGPATQLGICHLKALDISDNGFSGSLPRPLGNLDDSPWAQLQTLRLNNNGFTGTIPTWHYDEAPLLAIMTLNNNSLTGTLPVSWTLLPWLTQVDVSFNDLSGDLPWQLAFQSRLATFDISNNAKLGGTISPWFRLTVGLQVFNAHGTNITGVLPGITRSQFRALNNNTNRLCGSNDSGFGRLPYLDSVSISSTNMSADCPPDGICNHIDDALPWYLTEDHNTWLMPLPEDNFSENANMQCPMLIQDQFCRRNQTPEYFQLEHRPIWRVSPSYYHYIGCRCASGYYETRETRWHGQKKIRVLTCNKNTALGSGTVAAISAVCSFVCLLLLAYCAYVSWYGRWGLPKLQRAYVDFKKRLYGIPTSGRVSLVVTDIESYSAMMVAMPLVMGKALSQHNNVIRKAAWMHYGFITGQEGDAYIVAFREAMDAAAFCLQVQQALRKVDWPSELLIHQQQQDSAAAFPHIPAVPSAAAGVASLDTDSSSHSVQPSLRGDEVPMTPDSTPSAAVQVPVARHHSLSVHGRAANHHSPNTAAGEGLGSSDGSGVSLGKFWPFRPIVGSPVPPVGRIFSGAFSREPSNSNRLSPTILTHAASMRRSLDGATPAATGQSEGAPGQEPQQQQQQQQQLAPISAVSVLIPGLRVRMGIASGSLGEREDCLNCKVLDVARAVSDAASGGQVLMDSTTFGLIRSRLEELGQVSAYGYRRSNRVTGWGQPRGWLARMMAMQNVQLATEAVVLDMGLYSIPGFPFKAAADEAGLLPALPGMPQSAPGSLPAAGASTAPAAEVAAPAPMTPTPAPSEAAGTSGIAAGHPVGFYSMLALQKIQESPVAAGATAAHASASPAGQGAVNPSAANMVCAAATSSVVNARGVGGLLGCLRLYQMLAPKLIERAHIFGNRLSLKEGSACHDLPYFSAPAAASRPMLQQLLQQPAAASLHTTTSAQSGSMLATVSQHRKFLSMLSFVQQQQQQVPAVTGAADSSRHNSGDLAAPAGMRVSPVQWLLQSVGSLPDNLLMRYRHGRLSRAGTGAGGGAEPLSSISPTSAYAGLGTGLAGAGLRERPTPPSTCLFAVGGGGCAVTPLPRLPGLRPQLSLSGDAATTFVFCSVVLHRHRLDATGAKVGVTSQVAAIVGRVIRQCLLAITDLAAAPAVDGNSGSSSAARGSGYLCRDSRTDMKYILAFSTPRLALEWCLLVQEVMLWQDWPAAAVDKPRRSSDLQHTSMQGLRGRSLTAQWQLAGGTAPAGASALPSAVSAAGEEEPAVTGSSHPLFRGPRIKMGVAAGAPQSVWPDYLGRADYHGHAVNMAARYEAVCCQGGQVVCDAMLAEAVLTEWMDMKMPAAHVSAITEAPSVFTEEAGPAAAAAAAAEDEQPLHNSLGAADGQQQQQEHGGNPLQHPLASGRPPVALSSPFQQAATLPGGQSAAGDDSEHGSGGGGGGHSAPMTVIAKRWESAALPEPVSGTLAAEAGGAASDGPIFEVGSAPSSVPLMPSHKHTKPRAAAARGQRVGRPWPGQRDASLMGSYQQLQQLQQLQHHQQSAVAVDGSGAGGFRGWLGGPRSVVGSTAGGAGAGGSGGGAASAGATPTSAPSSVPLMPSHTMGRRGSRAMIRTGLKSGSVSAAAVMMEPPTSDLPCPSCVSQLPCETYEVELHRIGKFQLKGAAGPVDMVEVVFGHLAGRRLLLSRNNLPKGGKGKLLEPAGPGSTLIAAVSGVQLPAIGAAYQHQFEQRCAAAAAAVAAAAAAVAAAEAELQASRHHSVLWQRSDSAATGGGGGSSSSSALHLRQSSPYSLFSKSMSAVAVRTGSWRSSYHSAGSAASHAPSRLGLTSRADSEPHEQPPLPSPQQQQQQRQQMAAYPSGPGSC